MSEERTDIVEIDAIAVEEWDNEQHTPVHAESNLAELVKKTGLDAGWDVPTKEETAASALVEKPRTTANTMRRTGAVPAVGKVHKTMALPTVAVVHPATKTTATGVTPVARPAANAAAAKPAAKSATKTTATGVTPVVQPTAATTTKPAAKPATKTTATGVPPVAQQAATPAPPERPAAKPATKTTATGVTPVVPSSATPAEAAATKPATPKSATKTTATGVAPVVQVAASPTLPATKPSSTKTTATGVAPVVSAAAPTFSPFGGEPAAPIAVAAKPARTDATPVPAAKPARTDATPAKPARTDATPAKPATPVEAAKPARADATPAPTAKPARADATPAKAVEAAKPARTDATPAPATAKPARTDATPAPARPAAPQPKPSGEALAARLAAADAPRAPSAFELPAWPPTPAPAGASKDFEDWDEVGGATSVGTQERTQAPRAPGEDSVIVDLNAVSKSEHQPAKRPQSVPILTSEQGTTTSGAFNMPTPAQPMAAQPAAAYARTDKPTSPAMPAAAASLTTGAASSTSHAGSSSTAWHTPLPLAAPPPEPVPQWPSAAGLEYNGAHGSAPEIPLPAPRHESASRHEPTEPRLERRTLLATVFPTPKSRKKGLLIAAGALAAVLLIAVFSAGGSSQSTDSTVAKKNRAAPSEAASAASAPSTLAPSSSSTSKSTPAKSSAAAATVAIADPVTAPPSTTTEPARKKPIVAKRRISRGKKPVVVDYDKKPDPTPDQDESLVRARADYVAGNHHLFAGETAAAIASYRQALAVYPNYVAGYRGLGLAFAQQGNKSSALDAFKTYLKLAPTAKDAALIKKRIASLSIR